MFGGTGRRRFFLVTAILVLAAAVFTLGATGSGEEDGALQIAVGDVLITDSQLTAAVSVTNPDALRHEFEVWLTLGRFGGGEAWSRRVAESSSKQVAVRSGEELEITWDESIAVPEGWYEVTAWVRLEGRTGQVLQQTRGDGAQAAGSVGLSRVSLDLPEQHITDVEMELDGESFARFTGSADAVASGAAVFKIDVLPLQTETPWWAQSAVETFLVQPETTADGKSSTDFDQVVPIGPGEYRVRLQLLVSDLVVDQVLLADRLVVEPPDASIVRSVPPVGPIAIVAANTSDDWSEGPNRIVTVEVENLTPDPVEALFWWILAAPGDPEPWSFADGRSFDVTRVLEPFEKRTIRLATNGDPAGGQAFELSVWTHSVDQSGETTHSDGVRLPGLVNTTAKPENGEQ